MPIGEQENALLFAGGARLYIIPLFSSRLGTGSVVLDLVECQDLVGWCAEVDLSAVQLVAGCAEADLSAVQLVAGCAVVDLSAVQSVAGCAEADLSAVQSVAVCAVHRFLVADLSADR